MTPSNVSSLLRTALVENLDSPVTQFWRRLLLILNLPAPLLVLISQGSAWSWSYAFLIHGILLIGLFVPNSTWLGPILKRLPTDQKEVWLTIDDGPSDDTPILAEILGKMGVSATFFLRGKELAARPQVLSMLLANGHSVAHHTWHHSLAWFWTYSQGKVEREIADFAALVAIYDSPMLPAFRCPAGVKNPFLHTALQRHGLTLVGWTVRAYDGITCDIASGLARLLQGLRPGAILLVHEGKNDGDGTPASVELVRQLVEKVRAKGYVFVNTSEGSKP